MEKSKALPTKESILVIDDSLDMLDTQKTVLELNGFEVFTAQSGGEALKVLSEIAEPDLILLDVQMEGMNGFDFLALLEKKKPEIIEDVPVVFLTGMNELPPSKAAGLIRKVHNMDEFLEAVHRFIEMGHHSPYRH